MSIYEQMTDDIAEIIADRDGFFVSHNVNGKQMPAAVHSVNTTNRSGIVSNIEYGVDVVCIVGESDFGDMPAPGAVFDVDEEEFRVASANRIGGHMIRISLTRPEV